MSLTSFLQLGEFDFCNEWNPLYPLPQHEFWEDIFHNTKSSLKKISFMVDSSGSERYFMINEILLLFNHCKQFKEFSFSGDDFDANESLIKLGILVPTALRSLTIKDGHIGGWTLPKDH
ncbi:hypothetical protein GLOIN_2v1788520 [Rhizophagus clarus]|uniref:Uncharacterized protein n=1 Tax=Rhizophagus clarus TaxID=94130 RepID=A0A8H3QUZ9_9GLOM|nr:hypothetical protein GLOIN_2v1788520 [Rhizophagus clarus]